MTVTAKLLNRDTYEIGYGEGKGPGPINAVLTNPETGDVSSYQGPDDGKFLVTTAVGYAGTADVEIRKLEAAPRPDPKDAEISIEWDLGGRKIDSGSITFGAEIDNTLPPTGEIDNELPEGPVFPDNDLPWHIAHPDHDLPSIGGHPDNTLPGVPGHPDNELPPSGEIDNELPAEGGTPDNTLPETPEPK